MTFLVIPAIDLKDGECVRLRQGRMEESTVFSQDPLAMAAHWVAAGARRLHLVDLNGAFAGNPVNGEIITAISRRFPQLPIQIGGGIRSLETAERYLIIGTQAVKQPSFVAEACRAFPGHIMVGLDARGGRVATEGWAEQSGIEAVQLARQFADCGVSALIYTDIGRDGMMQGVNIEATVELARAAAIPVIASGGVTSIDDIRALKKVASSGIIGAITGRAIYEGSLDLAAAQRLADSEE